MVIPVKIRAKAGTKVFLSYLVLLDFLTICHKFCQEILICQETTDNILYISFDPRFFKSSTKFTKSMIGPALIQAILHVGDLF